MKTLAAIALVAATASPVLAEPDYNYGDSSSERDSWSAMRFEGAIGALIGSERVGTVAGTAAGMHFDAGLKRDRLFAYGEYDFLSVGQSAYDVQDPVRGFMHRFGLDARYSIGKFGGHGETPVRGDVWGEVGVGYEDVFWREGGRLGRKDLSFGFGAQATFRIGRDHPHFIGIYYAMKTWIARTPATKARPPMCAGPCDEPTGPSPYDFGMMFNFGVPFGR